jgi:hypothetical protein
MPARILSIVEDGCGNDQKSKGAINPE